MEDRNASHCDLFGGVGERVCDDAFPAAPRSRPFGPLDRSGSDPDGT